MNDEGKTKKRRLWFWAVFGLFLIGLGLQVWSSPSPRIGQLELAFSHEGASEVLEIWGPDGQAKAVRNLKLDFLFIPGYVSLLLVTISIAMRRDGRWLYKYAKTLCLAPIVAGALDVIENFLLLGILDHPGSTFDSTVQAAGWVATIKFSLLLFTMLALVVFAQRTQGLGTEDDDLEQHFRAFVRQARDSSHKALFFLGLMHETHKESQSETILRYSRFGIREVLRLQRRVVPPEGAIEAASTQHDEEPSFRYRTILDKWSDLGELIRRAQHGEQPFQIGATFEATGEIRRRLKEFLRVSLAQFWWERIAVHWLSDALRHLYKRLAFVAAAAVVALITWKLEAVHSLLFNQLPWTLAAVAWLLVPGALRLLYLGRWKGKEMIPSWDVGGRPFRSFWFAATEPGRLLRRFPVAALDESQRGSALGRKALRAMGADKIDSLLRIILREQLIRLAVFFGWWVLGALLFFIIAKGPEIVDSRLTAYLICSILFALLVGARFVDFWEFLDPAPVRIIIVGLAVAAAVGGFLGLERLFFVPFFAAAVGYGLWYFKDRSRGLRLVFALAFFLCGIFNLIGGHTQKEASWAEEPGQGVPLVRLAEAEWPHVGPAPGPVVVMAASGGGSRAALVTGITLKQLHIDNPEVADRLQAISSVSGGSLANASYLARRLDQGGYEKLDVALSQDFVLPTLWGLLAPGINRGDGIEMAWQGFERRKLSHYFDMVRYPCGSLPKGREVERTTVALANECLSDLVEEWEEGLNEDLPRLPMPLFNTTTLDGHDVVISPLAKVLYTRRDRRLQPPREPMGTWVHNRDAIYGLEDLLPGFNPPLSSAVRASANFPFGFPLVRIRTKKKLVFSPLVKHHMDSMKDVYLTDGGALSNSGMFSLFNLLINRRDALVDRGVLLIIVDASKMPTYPSSGKGINLYGTIGDQSPVGQNLHRRMFDLLAEAYGPMLAVSQIDLIPEEDKNVLTTWALSKTGREALISQFLGEDHLDKNTPCAGEKSRWCEESQMIAEKFDQILAAVASRQAALERWEALEPTQRELLVKKAECRQRLAGSAERWSSMVAEERTQVLEAAGCDASDASLEPLEELLTRDQKEMLVAVHSRFERLVSKYGEELRPKGLIEDERPPLD